MPIPVSRIERTLFSLSGIRLLVRVEDRGIGQRQVSDLVEGIGGVGDELAQKISPCWNRRCLLKGVSNGHDKNALRHTDDEIEELTDLSLEYEAFTGGRLSP
jgi:hypothetical protein